jgi:hypothetical protein
MIVCKDLNICYAKLQNGLHCNNKICQDLNPFFIKYEITDNIFINNLTENNSFCKIHIETYIKDMYQIKYVYSKEDVEKFTKCNGCNVYKSLLEFNGYVTCIKCRSRIKPKIKKDKCLYNCCKFEQIKYKNNDKPLLSLNCLYPHFCGIHQLEGWLIDLNKKGYKPCSMYNHNSCRNELLKEYEYNTCSTCRTKNRATDKIRHDNKIQKAKLYNNTIVDKKKCSKCLNEYDFDQYYRFTSNNSRYRELTDHCLTCRKKQSIIEANRPSRIRNYKEYESRIEVKERKKLYRKFLKENEPEKYKMYSILHRIRLREKLGEVRYLRLMADRMKDYLKRNPNKRLELNELKKKSLQIVVSNYKRSAETREIDYNLSDEETKQFLKNECFYCKDISDNGYLNGIDRKDNNIGYDIDNCVTCCKMCNISKKTMSVDEFIGKVYHILSYTGLINEDYNYEELFKNRIHVHYRDYENRANKKFLKNNNFLFELTKEQYLLITSMNCYLCGKEPSNIHLNGIDRIDSKIGYEFGNILSCCGDCNYIKNEYNINNLLIKFYQIYFKKVLLEDEKNIILKKIDNYVNNKLDEVVDNINLNISDVAGMVFDYYYYDRCSNIDDDSGEIGKDIIEI